MNNDMEEELEVPKMQNTIPNILITGTPGVGKTTLSRLLCEYVDSLTYINLGKIYIINIKKNKIKNKQEN